MKVINFFFLINEGSVRVNDYTETVIAILSAFLFEVK